MPLDWQTRDLLISAVFSGRRDNECPASRVGKDKEWEFQF